MDYLHIRFIEPLRAALHVEAERDTSGVKAVLPQPLDYWRDWDEIQCQNNVYLTEIYRAILCLDVRLDRQCYILKKPYRTD